MINPQSLELPMFWTNFHGPKDVRAIEVRLFLKAHSQAISEILDNSLSTLSTSL